MPKRKNKRRKDGMIPVQVYLGRKPDGSRDCRTVYGLTQKEADEKANELKALLRKGMNIESQNDTFGEWADRWFRVKSSERISSGRLVVYESNINHLKRYLKDIPIIKMRSAGLQEVLIKLSKENPNTKKPMAEKTMKGIKSTANQIFQFAIENRVLEYNPADSLKIPSSPTMREVRSLEEAEQQWICETDHRAKRAAMVMMYSGLRRGELIPLTWKDIDFKECTITVNKAVEKKKDGTFELKELSTSKELVKSEYSYRVVDVPQRLIDYLAKEPRENIYVCVTANSKMHTESSWKRMWESYLSDLNMKYGDFSPFGKQYQSKFDPEGIPFVIPKINPHWLRHTFCTMLYYAGYDLKSAMEQMGHADIATTLKIYTHLDKKHKRKQIRKLDDYLDPKEYSGNNQVSNS